MMPELEVRLVTAEEVDGPSLDAFLRRFFPPAHCDFLLRHGEWWHQGPRNRLVALVGDTVAGYSALIPAPCRLDGRTYRAHWWVDLIIDPEFRQRGLQARMDRRVKEQTELLLGFPNALAAKIHRRHGWGVSEQHRTMLLPFEPTRLRPVMRASGPRAAALRTVTRLARPFGRLLRKRADRYQPVTAHRLETPEPEALGEIFERYHDAAVNTTSRDAEYLKWRYFDAPYRDELGFFVAGEPPRLAAISRSRETNRGRTVKLLDLFGDLEDAKTVDDLLRLVARQAASENAVEVAAFVTLPELFPTFRAAGFVLRTTARSCWLSPDPAAMRLLDRRRSHWTFGDSDQEEPA